MPMAPVVIRSLLAPWASQGQVIPAPVNFFELDDVPSSLDDERKAALVVAPVDVVHPVHVIDPRLERVRARDRIPPGAPIGTTVGGEGDARARSERLRIRVGPSGQVAIDPEADANDGAGRRRDRADVLHGG